MVPTHEEIVAYYGQLPRKGGYDSRCDLFVPGGLDRAVMIDLGSRRGLGSTKFASLVGPMGHVYGVEWAADMVETARERKGELMAKDPEIEDVLDYICCYPEEMVQDSGIMEESVDVVFVNSVLNLLCDPIATLRQISLLLRPAGTLYCQTVLATAPRNEAVVEEARKLGNAVQSAPYRKDFARWLHMSGFDVPSFKLIDSKHVEPDAAAEEGKAYPTSCLSEEGVSFNSCVISVDKLGGFDYQELIRQDIAEFR